MKLSQSTEAFTLPQENKPRPAFLQETVPLDKIMEKLIEGKDMYDAMFLLDELTDKHRNIQSKIQQLGLSLQNEHMENRSGSWQIIGELRRSIDDLTNEDKRVLSDIHDTKEQIEKLFDVIEAEGDDEIKKLVQRRRDYYARYEKHQCNGIGNVKSVCVEIDRVLAEVTRGTLMKYTEYFWKNRRLAEFKPTETFVHPGMYQAHPAYLDIKAVVDGGQRIAIVDPMSETDASDKLLVDYGQDISIMFVKHPNKKVVYHKDAAKEAREMVDLLETRGNRSKDPEVVFYYYMRLARLLGLESEKARSYGISKAKKLTPNFEPLSE